MVPSSSADLEIVTNFTFAFFEDSGWYQINYTFLNDFIATTQQELLWGKGYTMA